MSFERRFARQLRRAEVLYTKLNARGKAGACLQFNQRIDAAPHKRFWPENQLCRRNKE